MTGAYVALVISGIVALVLLRRPLLGRLALRHASRRPRETLLIVLGSLLGTAIITASFVVGDTLTASIRQGAFSTLGPVDELVVAPSAAAQTSDLSALGKIVGKGIQGAVPMKEATVALSAGAGRHFVYPNATAIEISYPKASQLGTNPAQVGLSGPTPPPGTADVSTYLATKLHLAPGGHLELFAFGKQRTLRVRSILAQVGIAGLNTSGFVSANVFVAPGTLGSLSGGSGNPGSQAAIGHLIAVSNGGGVIAGSDRTASAIAAMKPVLGSHHAQIQAVKKELLSAANAAGKQFTDLFSGIGFFSVLAGVLLLVNIFVMLSQERRRELGTLRALGMTRAGVISAFVAEGWLYAAASSVAGVVAGLGVGWLVVHAAASLFGSAQAGSLHLAYSVRATSLATSFGIGFSISMATIFATSAYVARLNVTRAIRELPEPPHRPGRLSVLVAILAAVGGAGATYIGATDKASIALLAGPAICAGGIVSWSTRLSWRSRNARRITTTLLSALVLAWTASAFSLFPGYFSKANISAFVTQGVVLTAAGVALVSSNQVLLARLLAALAGGRSRLSFRLGFAYPLWRSFRTSMILSMYSLVVFMLVFVTVFSHIFAEEVNHYTNEVSGGFAMSVTSNPANPVTASSLSSVHGVTAVAALPTTMALWKAPFHPGGFQPWPATSFNHTFVSVGPPALAVRPAQYKSDRAAYAALLAKPNLAIVSNFFLNSTGRPNTLPAKPGDVLELRNPTTGATATLHLAAVAHAGFGNTLALVSPSTMASLFPHQASPSLSYVATSSPSAASQTAAAIDSRFFTHGAVATDFRSEVHRNLAQQEQFFRLMEGYLALGLLVGIAGLGVVMLRSVRERRREIGTLRAIGFMAGAVRATFLVESAFVAAEGIAIGTVLAIATSWQLATSKVFGAPLPFSIPIAEVLALVTLTLAASILATMAPAQQASRIRPAVALRIDD